MILIKKDTDKVTGILRRHFKAYTLFSNVKKKKPYYTLQLINEIQILCSIPVTQALDLNATIKF